MHKRIYHAKTIKKPRYFNQFVYNLYVNTAQFKKPHIPYNKLLPLALLFVAIMGISVPNGEDIHMKIGTFNIRPYNYGLFIEQANSAIFYNVSPFNFYYANSSNYENTAFKQISANETTESSQLKDYFLPFTGEISMEANLKSSPLKMPILLYKTALSYFHKENPSATFSNTAVEANRNGNTAIFRPYKTGRDLNGLIMTFSFNDSDIIFDQKGTLYTNIDQEVKEDFEKVYEFAFEIQESSESSEAYLQEIEPSGVQNILIFNHTTPGIFKIKNNNGIQQIRHIDLDHNLIEFNLLDQNDPRIEIQLFDSVKEGLQND